MIAYRISRSELHKRIAESIPGWQRRAQSRTQLLVRTGTFRPLKVEFWNRLKPLLLDIQHHKCGYCERLLYGGNHECDVDHYRPKGRVTPWPELPDVDSAIGDDFVGYHALAYMPENYVVSCKTCNSKFKESYFPIASRRAASDHNPSALAAELPYLLCPVGEDDPDDPQHLINFIGPAPVESHTEGHRFRRAHITIKLLALDRDELIYARCRLIADLYVAHLAANSGDPVGEQTRTQKVSATSEFASCAQCFDAICRSDMSQAREIAMRAVTQLRTRK